MGQRLCQCLLLFQFFQQCGAVFCQNLLQFLFLPALYSGNLLQTEAATAQNGNAA